MKFKYVGKKERETAFSEATGIVWEPGAEHEVADAALCKRMLSHPDVFEAVALVVQAEPVKPEPDQPDQPDAPAEQGLSDATKADKPTSYRMQTAEGELLLDALDAETLHKLAKDSGIKVHPNAGAKTVAAKLAEAFPVKAE